MIYNQAGQFLNKLANIPGKCVNNISAAYNFIQWLLDNPENKLYREIASPSTTFAPWQMKKEILENIDYAKITKALASYRDIKDIPTAATSLLELDFWVLRDNFYGWLVNSKPEEETLSDLSRILGHYKIDPEVKKKIINDFKVIMVDIQAYRDEKMINEEGRYSYKGHNEYIDYAKSRFLDFEPSVRQEMVKAGEDDKLLIEKINRITFKESLEMLLEDDSDEDI